MTCRSKKQSFVARSSAEAEYKVMAGLATILSVVARFITAIIL